MGFIDNVQKDQQQYEKQRADEVYEESRKYLRKKNGLTHVICFYLFGEDVFRNLHNYWRTSFSPTLSTAEALYHAVPETVASDIDGKYSYPAELNFKTEDEKWMSKLALDFYMSMLKYDSNDPEAFKDVDVQTLLYDQVNPAQIEGGGRVIAATKDGTFTIPEDAGKPLVYIGFDKDFNPVTDIIYK